MIFFKLLGYLIAVTIISSLTGLLFLWAGITGSLMKTYFFTEGIVRDFTLWGTGFGVVLAGWGIWIVEKGKRNGQS